MDRPRPRGGASDSPPTIGTTNTVYPDFLIWRGDEVLAVDTKGEHLLLEAAGRKLLSITPAAGVPTRLSIHFVSRGRFNEKVEQLDKEGTTLWWRREYGRLRAAHADSVEDTLKQLLAGECRRILSEAAAAR